MKKHWFKFKNNKLKPKYTKLLNNQLKSAEENYIKAKGPLINKLRMTLNP